jgi:hypothetical protein
VECRVCASELVIFGDAVVLGRHQAAFLRCDHCGSVAVHEPYWLDEAYSQAITASDMGLVERNVKLARITGVLISLFFNPAGRFLDYAGGYGLFVRLMRDAGYDFCWYDKYCSNLFAGPFIHEGSGVKRYELITAFELLEHLEHPLQELEQMLALSDAVLFTTNLLPEPAPKPGDWWYYGLEHGQHITFYTLKSLELLAERFGCKLYTNGSTMHLLTRKKLPAALFWLLARCKGAALLAPFAQRRSLLPQDMHGRGLKL